MTWRTLPAFTALGALTGAVVVGGAVPARAATGLVRLTMSKQGPVWGDNNSLTYNMELSNAGPDTATGLVVEVTGWMCEGDAYSTDACHRVVDPATGQAMVYDVALDSLAPGETFDFPVVTPLPDENAGTARTTAEVVKVDQYDTGSATGTCNQGWHPQPDCVSDVVRLR